MSDNFFQTIARDKITDALGDMLTGADDGELFLEHRTTESLTLSDSIIKNANYDISAGFGLRSVKEDAESYAFSCEVNEAAISKAGKIIRNIIPKNAHAQKFDLTPQTTPKPYYQDQSPIDSYAFADKTELLTQLDGYLRQKR